MLQTFSVFPNQHETSGAIHALKLLSFQLKIIRRCRRAALQLTADFETLEQ